MTLALLLLLGAAGLVWRAVHLQIHSQPYLTHQGDLRSSRILTVPAHRGQITDREGRLLAVSTPADAPAEDSPEALRLLASGFAAPVPHGYRRYYPEGEVTGHLLGFTDYTDSGQEGLERTFNDWLQGQSGQTRIRQDARGRMVEEIEQIRPVRPGRDLRLSLDLPLQRLAYEELAQARTRLGAVSASAVVLDVATGEVLALVSEPSYNPNLREQLGEVVHRNHAIIDLLEPGSTLKPFVVAAALAEGRYTPASRIDTSPGYLEVDHVREQDEHNLGVIDLPTVLARSSNVGMARLALSLVPRHIWQTLTRVGFGKGSGSGFPGEPSGVLTSYPHWRPATIATLSHGYGISVTPLQLARAYATVGALGVARPVSLVALSTPPPGERVLPATVCRALLTMLESVVAAEGATGALAAIPGYRVAGKTGTVEKLHAGHYDGERYTALFAGLAPAAHPRLVAVVVVDEIPGTSPHQGGQVAAPLFSRLMEAALHRLGVPPDRPAGRPRRAPLRVDARTASR